MMKRTIAFVCFAIFVSMVAVSCTQQLPSAEDQAVTTGLKESAEEKDLSTGLNDLEEIEALETDLDDLGLEELEKIDLE